MTTPAKGLGTFDKSTMPTVRPALLLLLTACGGPFVARDECEGLGVARVYGEDELDCALVASRMALAREVLVSRGLVPEEKFASAFGDVTVWVRANNEPFRCDAEKDEAIMGGCYYVRAREILTTKDMETIVHEMLHHWQLAVLGIDPDGPMHPGWTENGYRDADVSFRRVVFGL